MTVQKAFSAYYSASCAVGGVSGAFGSVGLGAFSTVSLLPLGDGHQREGPLPLLSIPDT